MIQTFKLGGMDLSMDMTGVMTTLEAFSPLVSSLLAFHAALPVLLSLKVDKLDAATWRYVWKTTDLRTWKQKIKWDGSAILQNFDVADFFKMPEFVMHRAVRDAVQDLIISYGLVSMDVAFG